MLLNEDDGANIGAIPPATLVQLVVMAVYMVHDKAAEPEKYADICKMGSVECLFSNRLLTFLLYFSLTPSM